MNNIDLNFRRTYIVGGVEYNTEYSISLPENCELSFIKSLVDQFEASNQALNECKPDDTKIKIKMDDKINLDPDPEYLKKRRSKNERRYTD